MLSIKSVLGRWVRYADLREERAQKAQKGEDTTEMDIRIDEYLGSVALTSQRLARALESDEYWSE